MRIPAVRTVIGSVALLACSAAVAGASSTHPSDPTRRAAVPAEHSRAVHLAASADVRGHLLDGPRAMGPDPRLDGSGRYVLSASGFDPHENVTVRQAGSDAVVGSFPADATGHVAVPIRTAMLPDRGACRTGSALLVQGLPTPRSAMTGAATNGPSTSGADVTARVLPFSIVHFHC